jgi:hypothetical protein
VLGVAKRLLVAVRERPEGMALGVTDGTAGSHEDKGTAEE